jgi:hypothetical protein
MKQENGYKLGSWYGEILSVFQSVYNFVYGLSSTAWNQFNEKFCKSFKQIYCPTVDINSYREDMVCLEDKYFVNLDRLEKEK